MDVIPSSDEASHLVSLYAQNEISIDELTEKMKNILYKEQDEVVLMINIDQLCQGASYHREDEEKLSLLFSSIFEMGKALGASFITPSAISPTRLGYLNGSWYGRDASTQSVTSFNELFVKNGSYRYYLGRVLALAELASECKKDRTVRRAALDLLSTIPSGPMFLCDTMASAIRLGEHRYYYKTLLDAEERLREIGSVLTSVDIDNDLYEEEFCYGKVNSAVFSRVGGSVLEYNAKELGINIFDTVPPWQKVSEEIKKYASFTELITFNGITDDLSGEVFELEGVRGSRTDFNFSYFSPNRSYQLLKHYRLSNQNLYLSITFINEGDEKIEGECVSQIYFTLPDSSAFSYDSKRELLVGNALSSIKSVRFSDANNQLGLFFTSTDYFTATEENRYQSEVTAIGSEQFYLYTKLLLAFKLNVAPRSAATFNIVTRINTKEKE